MGGCVGTDVEVGVAVLVGVSNGVNVGVCVITKSFGILKVKKRPFCFQTGRERVSDNQAVSLKEQML